MKSFYALSLVLAVIALIGCSRHPMDPDIDMKNRQNTGDGGKEERPEWSQTPEASLDKVRAHSTPIEKL